MAFDIGQLLGGVLSGAGGVLSGAGSAAFGQAGAGGAGTGLLGGQPGLVDLIPAFQFQNDDFGVSFDPQKLKRDRAIRRLIEEQRGERVPGKVTETAGNLGGIVGGGSNFVTPQGSAPGFRGFNPFGTGGRGF